MTKLQRTENIILSLLVVSSLFFSHDGECSELTPMSKTNKKLFAPRLLMNIGMDMVLSTGFAASGEKITTAEVAVLFLANSVLPVFLFQNYHSVTPFLATIAFTGATFAVTEFVVEQSGGGYNTLLWRTASWWVLMPLIVAKTNHIFYLKRYKKRQLELNLLQPTYLGYDNKMVPGVHLIQLSW